MGNSLDGAPLKLRRAREHLEVLGNELAAFNAVEPYRITHESNADGSEHVFYAQVLKEPPPFLSVIIGDALQNMRSALDHLAWGLTPQSTRDTSERTIGFPICNNRQAFEQADRSSPSGYNVRTGMHKIWTMDSKVRAAIHQLQPYKSGHDDLLILNELARVDRHQSLRFMGAFSSPVTQSWRKKGLGAPFTVDFSCFAVGESNRINLGPFEDGAEIAYFRFREPEMEVNLQIPRHVTFRDAGPASGKHALSTLTSIRRHIERVVVPKLERYF